MALTGPVPDHPAEFSDEVLDVVRPLLDAAPLTLFSTEDVRPLPDAAPLVFDPFAGRGRQLGELCDVDPPLIGSL